MMSDIVVYESGEIELKITLNNETLWLKAQNIAALFGVNRPAIVKHIGNIYKTDELQEHSTCSILEQVAKDGKKRIIKYYNLDMIIAIGYRVNSKKATQFRIWATDVLKKYIYDGYAINSQKITLDRFLQLENDVSNIQHEFQNIKDDKKAIHLKQGVFYNGQIFDAYVLINDIFKSAKQDIEIIDNYIDDTVLTLFSKYPKLHFTIVTKNISKKLQLDIKKYQAQYNNLKVKISNSYHDRFLIVDNKDAYHIGASLKDLGKKVFAFSKIDIDMLRLVDDE